MSPGAMIDEAVPTGEPIPVTRREGELARSGTVNAGETFEIRATATAGESTHAGIIRLVNAAQAAKAPFIRLADRYALLLFPITLIIAGSAWLLSGDPIRGLAVLVAATPCPLILAAPVAFIAGVAQAARLGILIKGGKPFEALARTRTVMFDKTGTLTVGGARLVAIEAAPGERPEDVLRIAGSLEQASHHVVAAAIVEAARGKGLDLQVPTQVRETMGSGLEGMIDGCVVRVGSHQLVYVSRKPDARFARRRACYRGNRSLKGFQKTDEIPDLVRIQPELRHAWMTRRHPFGERIFERFHRIPLVKGPKWRRRGAWALAGPFNRMTVRALGYCNGPAAANALFVSRCGGSCGDDQDDWHQQRDCRDFVSVHLNSFLQDAC